MISHGLLFNQVRQDEIKTTGKHFADNLQFGLGAFGKNSEGKVRE